LAGPLIAAGLSHRAELPKRPSVFLAEPEGFEPSIGLYKPITV
jgi:hypothetical protein